MLNNQNNDSCSEIEPKCCFIIKLRSKDCSGVNFASLILQRRSQSKASPPCAEVLFTFLRQSICCLYILLKAIICKSCLGCKLSLATLCFHSQFFIRMSEKLIFTATLVMPVPITQVKSL